MGSEGLHSASLIKSGVSGRDAVARANLIGRPPVLRTMNLARVWAELRDVREATRPYLAERTGLSRATISLVVDDLLAVGAVRPAGLGPSRGGRPAARLRVDPTACVAIGADMAAPDVRLVLVDLDGRVLARTRQRMADGTPDALVAALARGVADLVRGRPLRPAPCPSGRRGSGSRDGMPAPVLGLGLGATGVIDPESSVLRLSVPLGWWDVPLATLLSQRVGLPVRVLSEDQAAALAEHSFGVVRDARRLVYVGIGTGIGAGIVLDGQVYGGADGSAGELGHVTVLPDGPQCACGNRGCLEALAAGPQIVANAARRLRDGEVSTLSNGGSGGAGQLTVEQIAAAATGGDRLAGEVLAAAGQLIGIAVAGMINLLNPDAVVIGGDAARPDGPLLGALREEVRRRALAQPAQTARLLPASLGSDTTAVGAACLILREAPQLMLRLLESMKPRW
jgi:predicted NBD/HSP70 family sugar kinase